MSVPVCSYIIPGYFNRDTNDTHSLGDTIPYYTKYIGMGTILVNSTLREIGILYHLSTGDVNAA